MIILVPAVAAIGRGAVLAAFAAASFAQDPLQPPAAESPAILEKPVVAAASQPTYVALAPNINDFGRFADGGPDSNWYVGFNNAWIVQLPSAPIGEYPRAFIGAKLGRAKTEPRPGRPWERAIIPGKIYIAISPAPSFSSEQSFFLADTRDIPLEPDPKAYVSGAGQSQWFWAEVPPGLISFSGPNYLIAWSPTEYLVDGSSSPILAALEMRGAGPDPGARAWVNRSIQGVPPRRTTGTLETPIRHLYPALAIKLVPPNSGSVATNDCLVRSTDRGGVFDFSVSAQNAEIAWVERSKDRLEWERVSRFLRQPPYQVTLTPDILPARGAFFRAVARDQLANEGACEAQFISSNGSAP